MKRIMLMGMVAVGCAAFAQVKDKTGEEQFVIYKWYQKGRAHYAKMPPHGVQNYIKLNEYGLVINDRPAEDEFSGSILRPMRPAAGAGAQITPADKSSAPSASSAAATPPAAGNEPLPEGTITAEMRCKEAQENLNTINNKKTVYQEDSNGNLVPLSADEVESRRTEAQQTISSFCK